jgi:hypothetical protein
MPREDTRSDLIDLGTASVETKGPKGDFPDLAEGQVIPGLPRD